MNHTISEKGTPPDSTHLEHALADDPVEDRVETIVNYQAYTSCLEMKTVALGAFSRETPMDVVAKARLLCDAERSLFRERFYRDGPKAGCGLRAVDQEVSGPVRSLFVAIG